ncbi:MAG TPA: hypothetical protein VM369_11920 [Candidatus Binatia bacterium]|nr:hypothetical protein [Candidatus Binatia bacterium]
MTIKRMLACASGAALVFCGDAAAAEFLFTPTASAQLYYDSNVYRFSEAVARAIGTPIRADRVQRYTAGADSSYEWLHQKLRAGGEQRRFRYRNQDELDHDETLVEAAYDGALYDYLTPQLEYREERRLASFEDRRTAQPVMEHDQSGRAALGIALTPLWHVATNVRGRNLRSPLPAAVALPPPGPAARAPSPRFGLHEALYSAAVLYGVDSKQHPEAEAPLLAGVMVEYQTVSFSGVTPPGPPPPGRRVETFAGYRLLTFEGTAQYAVSGLSIFDGKLGVTKYNPKRTQAADEVPEITGEIGYRRGFTAVTELNGHLFRRIVAHANTAAAATDTGFSIGANWEPLPALIVLADYAWALSEFQGDGGSSENSGRRDRTQTASLSVSKPLSRSFGMRLFGGYSKRSSNLAFNSYGDKSLGVEFTFRWRGNER